MIRPQDRILSNAEKAQIIGFWRQCRNVLMVMGAMDLRQDTVEEIIQDYFGEKLSNTN